ncbi:unnamed protein product [Sphagnum balticum]
MGTIIAKTLTRLADAREKEAKKAAIKAGCIRDYEKFPDDPHEAQTIYDDNNQPKRDTVLCLLNDTSNVIMMPIKPKSVTGQIGQHHYTLSYDPNAVDESVRWRWHIRYTRVYEYYAALRQRSPYAKPDEDETEDDTEAVTGLTDEDATVIHDSPIDRMTVAQLTLDQLDAEIERIRVRRLLYTTKLKQRTNVSASVRWQQMYIEYSGLCQKMKEKIEKFDKQHDTLQIGVNKLESNVTRNGGACRSMMTATEALDYLRDKLVN